MKIIAYHPNGDIGIFPLNSESSIHNFIEFIEFELSAGGAEVLSICVDELNQEKQDEIATRVNYLLDTKMEKQP